MIVRAIVLVFGVRKQSRLAMQVAPELSVKNLVHTHNLFRPWNRQQLQRHPV